MNIENIEEILHLPICSKAESDDLFFSLGHIELGMHINSFLEEYVKTKYYYREKVLGVCLSFPKTAVYTFYDSVGFYFDITVGRMHKIYLDNKYKGLYRGSIGIGSSIGELRNIHPDLKYDDQYACIGDRHRLNFAADDDLTALDSEEEIDRCKIEGIDLRI